jgi:hypothetical protein
VTQTDQNAHRLALLTEYTDHITGLFPDGEAEENELVFVLQAFRITLQRRIDKRRPTVEWNDVMRLAVAESNNLLDAIYQDDHDEVINWNPALERPSNPQQILAGLLMTLCSELLSDIRIAEDYLRTELQTAAHEFAKEILAAEEAGRIE